MGLVNERSAAVLGCEFAHRPGACSSQSGHIYWRRDAAGTRRRGRLRYGSQICRTQGNPIVRVRSSGAVREI